MREPGRMGQMSLITLAVMAAILLAGCRSVKYVPVYIQNDSTETHVKTVTEYVKDTLHVKIPAQTAERTTADTTSHLENDYAESYARINPDGTLYHSLMTKPQDLEVEYDKPIQRRDSTVNRKGTTTVVRTVEVERELTWIEQGQIYGFRILAVLITLWLIWRYRSKITNLIRKLI